MDHFLFFHILGFSSSQLLLTPSFFRGLGQPPTSCIILLKVAFLTMDWDDPMLRDLAQLGPASVPGRARDGPGPLNPSAVIRALRAQRDPREAQPAPEERRSQSPTRRARRSSRSSRSNSPTLGQEFFGLDFMIFIGISLAENPFLGWISLGE